jgi:serine/threonine protein kinase
MSKKDKKIKAEKEQKKILAAEKRRKREEKIKMNALIDVDQGLAGDHGLEENKEERLLRE